jgi:hypothetical protein
MGKSERVAVFTLTRNEEAILPFFLKHYGEFADEIIIYDNDSTDRTVEIATAWPRTRVCRYSTGGATDDIKHRDLKNTIWKTVVPGWKIVVDCDEFIWGVNAQGKLNVREQLGHYSAKNVFVPLLESWEMVSNVDPVYDGSKHIWELIRYGARDGIMRVYDKRAVFKAPPVVSMGFTTGAHRTNIAFVANVNHTRFVETAYGGLKLLHFKYTSLAKVQRRCQATPLSQSNLRNQLGMQAANLGYITDRWHSIWRDRSLVVKW